MHLLLCTTIKRPHSLSPSELTQSLRLPASAPYTEHICEVWTTTTYKTRTCFVYIAHKIHILKISELCIGPLFHVFTSYIDFIKKLINSHLASSWLLFLYHFATHPPPFPYETLLWMDYTTGSRCWKKSSTNIFHCDHPILVLWWPLMWSIMTSFLDLFSHQSIFGP